MLTLDESLFIYDDIIPVYDLTSSVKSIPDNVKQSISTPTNRQLFYIKFGDKFPENIKDSGNILFNTFNIDESFVKKMVIKDIKDPHDKSKTVKCVCFPNFCMLRSFSLEMIKLVLAYFLNHQSDAIVPMLDYDNGNQHLCSNKPRDFRANEKNYHFRHQLSPAFHNSSAT